MTTIILSDKPTAPDLPDHELLAQVRAGNPSAFTGLVSRYHRMVFVVAYGYVRDRDTAEEVAQDVFLRAYLNLEKLQHAQCFPAWLNQITRNLALTWIRIGTRRSELAPMIPIDETHWDVTADMQHGPRETAQMREEQALVEKALFDLPEELKTLVLLRFSDGLPNREIARRLGVHPTSVGRQLDKALGLLRSSLGAAFSSERLKIAPRKDAAARTGVLVLAASALTGNGKAALVAAAATPAYQATVVGAGASAGILLQRIFASLIGVKGGLIAAVAVVAFVGAAVTVHWQSSLRSVSQDASLRGGRGHSPRATASPHRRTRRPRSGGVATPSQADSTTTDPVTVLSGRVALEGGAPAAGAKVRITWRHDGSLEGQSLAAVTQADGGYSLSWHRDEYSGNAFLDVSKPGYVGLSGLLEVESVGGVTLGASREFTRNLTMAKAVVLTGVVVDEEGKPVFGASVVAQPSEHTVQGMSRVGELTTSSATGRFEFSAVPGGSVSVSAHSDVCASKVISADAPCEDLVIKLESSSSEIQGVVLDTKTSTSVSRATVIAQHKESWFASQTTVTAADGSYRLEHLKSGQYDLYAFPEGEQPAPVFRGTPLTLGDKESTSINLHVCRGVTITGQVLDTSGAPLADVEITQLLNESTLVSPGDKTTSDGRYTITCRPNLGFVALTARKPGYRFQSPSDDPRSGHTTIRCSPDRAEESADIRMAAAREVFGKVVDQVGRPVRDARVQLLSNSDNAVAFEKTDAEGRFRLDAKPDAADRVLATATEFPAAVSELIQPGFEPVKDLIIRAQPGKTVRGTVIDQQGRPVSGAAISASCLAYVGDTGHSVGHCALQSDREGRFECAGPADCQMSLSASCDGYAPSEYANVELVTGSEVDNVSLVLKQSHFLAGTVRRKDGIPVNKAYVETMDRGRAGASTDSSGHYRLEGLTKAPERIQICCDRVRTAFPNSRIDVTDADFVLPDHLGKFICHVVDWKTSTPVTDLKVKTCNGKEIPSLPNSPGTFVEELQNSDQIYGYTIDAPGCVTTLIDRVELKTPGETVERTIRVGPGAVLCGRVVAGQDRKPLSGVRVAVTVGPFYTINWRSPMSECTTDGDGRFRLERIPAGEAKVELRPVSPYVASTTEVKGLKHEQTTDLGEIKLSEPGVIHGRFVNTDTGQPVVGGRISYRGPQSNGTMVTGPDGQFEVTGLSDGHVSFSQPENSIESSLWLKAGESPAVTLKTGNGTLSGTLTRGGKPAEAGVEVSLQHGDSHVRTRTGPRGAFLLKNLPSGRWEWSRSSSGAPKTVEVLPYHITEAVIETEN